MAYLFSKLNDAIEGQPSGRSSDVIGQQAGAPSGPAQADRETPRPGALGSQSSAVIGGQAAQPAAANEASTAVNSESRAKVFKMNQGAELKADTSGTSNAIAQTQADLQKEANKYVGEQKYSQVGDEVVSNAVKQADDGADERAAVQSLLYGAAKPVDEFAYNDSSLDGARAQVTGMNTTAGRQALIQERGDSTAGEARLDAALLGKSKAYQGQQADVIGQFGALKGVQEAEGKRTAQAVEQVGRERGADQERVRKSLEKLRTGASDADFSAFREENNARQGLNDKARATAAAVRAEMLQGAQFADSAGFAGVTNRAELDKMFEDPRLAKYLTAGAQLDKYTSADGAAQFNRVNELLMQGDRRSAVGSIEGRGGFDEAGYRAELARMLQERAPRLAAIPAAAASADVGEGASGDSIIPKSVDKGVAAVEAVKKAGRDIDPTSKDSYTNPVTGGVNVAKAAVQTIFPSFGKAPTSNDNSAMYQGTTYGNTGGNGNAFSVRQADTSKLTEEEKALGAKHLCGALHRRGMISDEVYAADLAYAKTVEAQTKRGYTAWALPLSKVVDDNLIVAKVCAPFVRAWANQMAGNPSWLGFVMQRVGEPACKLLGRFV